MSTNKFIAITVSVFVIASLAACNLTTAPSSVSTSGPVEGIPLETQVAEAVASTFSAQTALFNAVAATQSAMATNTPEFTFTASFTPSATFTFTPAVPVVSVSVNTNCRSGPTLAYDLLGVLKVGETAEVVGRSTFTDTIIIKLPSNPSINCWLWAQYASVVGDISGLPVISIPPTPTPKFTSTLETSFEVKYLFTLNCGTAYHLVFQITNNGGVTWESEKLAVTDQVTHVTNYYNANFFSYFNEGSCSEDHEDQNLEPGEVGRIASDSFVANPAGHGINATIQLCSGNDFTGICQEKTITFTP